MMLALSLFLGGLFGFALNRAGATNPDNIINMLRLTDLRLMKAIVFAIGVSAVGLFGGLALGLMDPSHVSIKAAYTGVIVGGALLGIGFAISGYCPGTGLTALATGRKDALVFVFGGLCGAFAFTLAYGELKESTSLFEKIAGGSVSLAQTGNEKYAALVDSVNGSVLGIGLGLAFVAVASLLPHALIKEYNRQDTPGS